MKKTTKGALAAGTAAVLLMGGAGTLAFWTESADVAGTGIESGHLEVTNNNCGTANWTLDGGTVVGAATRIIPGDTIGKTCTFTIDGEGTHFTDVDIAISAPSWAAGSNGALTGALGTVGATYTGNTVGPIASGDDIPVGEVVTATFSMTFNPATTDDVAEDVTATLDTIAITVTQNHL